MKHVSQHFRLAASFRKCRFHNIFQKWQDDNHQDEDRYGPKNHNDFPGQSKPSPKLRGQLSGKPAAHQRNDSYQHDQSEKYRIVESVCVSCDVNHFHSRIYYTERLSLFGKELYNEAVWWNIPNAIEK